MKYLKNQSGYALVLVMLIFVLFTVIALSLMGRTFTSVKQNDVAEENYQSVALAEMGVSYFQLAVKNGFDSNKADVLTMVRNQMYLDQANDELKDDSYYINLALTEMKARLEGTIEDSLKAIAYANKEIAGGKVASVKVSDGEGHYDLKYTPFSISADDLEITFESEGIEGKQSATLKATIKIPYDEITDDSSDENDEPDEGEGVSKLFDEIDRPTGACENPKNLGSCSKVLFTKDEAVIQGNFNGAGNLLIYADGSLDLSGNGNHSTIQKLHVERDLNIGKNMNHSSIELMEVKGDMSINGQFRLSDSKVYIGGDFITGGHFDLADHSFMYVAGTADIGKHLNIDKESTMCVGGGDIDFSKMNVSGNLYIKDLGYKQRGMEKYYLDEDSFNQACGLQPRKLSDLMTWGGNVEKTIEYIYE
jgi:Tfp pilus assembly protein PilV